MSPREAIELLAWLGLGLGAAAVGAVLLVHVVWFAAAAAAALVALGIRFWPVTLGVALGAALLAWLLRG